MMQLKNRPSAKKEGKMSAWTKQAVFRSCVAIVLAMMVASFQNCAGSDSSVDSSAAPAADAPAHLNH